MPSSDSAAPIGLPYTLTHGTLGQKPEDARDLTQGFFTQLIEKQSLSRADPERGRFRSYLLGAFKHFPAPGR